MWFRRKKSRLAVINITSADVVDPAEVGREIERYLREYRRRTGRPPLS